jgi:hypothetical protein
MEQHALKNTANFLNTNIYSYIETSGGKSYNLYLMERNQHLWQHLSWLKASGFFSLQKKFGYYETQQLILGTGTA